MRESQRIKGVVTITKEDIISQRPWEDGIGFGSFYIDIHNPAGPGMGGQTWPYFTAGWRSPTFLWLKPAPAGCS